MEWTPITEAELQVLIARGVANMEQASRVLWNLIRIPPVKWALPTWSDGGGGFWVVALLGKRVIWYNDIEDGFNVSPYAEYGVIGEYWCNQDELHHRIYFLLQEGEGHEMYCAKD
jgi:hypothetical protein